MTFMALGIYKPGQGYWVRVLTATFAGVLLLAASAWLWNQLENASGWIPIRSWTLTLRPAEGDVQPGQQLILYGEAARAADPAPQVGVATVRNVEPLAAGVRVEIADVRFGQGFDISRVNTVGPSMEGADPATLTGAVASVPLPQRAFDPLFLQAGGVAILILIGVGFIYYYVGAKAGSAEFLIATDGEMKKVNWSTRKDVIGSTWVVIVWSAMIASGLFVVDLVFANFFQFLGVLER
jgi:preprotein translocase SecE subunit